MKLIKNDKYNFTFAGQKLLGKFIGEDQLYDGTTVYMFDSENYIYPVSMKNIIKNNK